METMRHEIRRELAHLVARQRDGPVEVMAHRAQGVPLCLPGQEFNLPPSSAPPKGQARAKRRKRHKRWKRSAQSGPAAARAETGRRQPELSLKARTEAALLVARRGQGV